jgi:tRNA threonylcarbamoyladenosine biosynthesis protein TsaE
LKAHKKSIEETDSPEKTFAVAFELARRNPEASFFYLHGDLGAGKTLFTKGIASFHDIDPSRVTSPTFALVQRHSGGKRVLYHIDLYRIDDERELSELGIEELEEEGAVLVVEWAEKLGRRLREDGIDVALEVVGENRRRITIRCP